jgi:hypothetical protein
LFWALCRKKWCDAFILGRLCRPLKKNAHIKKKYPAKVQSRDRSRTRGIDGNSVYALAVLPDGKLVSGSGDKTVRVWENDTCVRVLDGHTSNVMALAAMPDGKLASGSIDRTVRLWDVASGACFSQKPTSCRCCVASPKTRHSFENFCLIVCVRSNFLLMQTKKDVFAQAGSFGARDDGRQRLAQAQNNKKFAAKCLGLQTLLVCGVSYPGTICSADYRLHLSHRRLVRNH